MSGVSIVLTAPHNRLSFCLFVSITILLFSLEFLKEDSQSPGRSLERLFINKGFISISFQIILFISEMMKKSKNGFFAANL